MIYHLLFGLLLTSGCAITVGSPTSQGDFSGLIGTSGNTPKNTDNISPSPVPNVNNNNNNNTAGAVVPAVKSSFSKPGNVKGQEKNGGLLVSWDPVTGAEGYRVYRDKKLWLDNLRTESVLFTASEWEQVENIAIEAYSGTLRSESVFLNVPLLRLKNTPPAQPSFAPSRPSPPPVVLTEAPSGLRYTHLGGQIVNIDWRELAGAKSYSVRIIYNDVNFRDLTYNDLTKPSIQLPSVPYDKGIRVTVWAHNEQGTSPVNELTLRIPAPSPSNTPTPLPIYTNDISVIETTTFSGRIFNDTNELLDGVTITAKSLNSNAPFTATTTTSGGIYSFNNVPSGVQIEIVASRNGFTTRRRVEVLQSNRSGDPNINKIDFGTNGSIGTGSRANALSDKPEVVMVTPERNASRIAPKTSFVLKFSEPMDRNSVEDAFSVHVYQDRALSIQSYYLLGSTTFLNVSNGQGGFTQTQSLNAALVWDESDFTATWNSDDTEVTFTFADEKLLPTDKNSAKVPEYMVSFATGNSAKSIKDKSGILRSSDWFKLTEGNFETYFKFAIHTDEVPPQVSAIIATSQEGGSLRGDAIKVRFSKRMLIDTKAGDIGTSNPMLNTDALKNLLNPTLYNLEITSGSDGTLYRNWGVDIQGSVVFDADDLTRKTVILLPADLSQHIFKRSDVVKVTVSDSITDPAGNTMESRYNHKTTTAG